MSQNTGDQSGIQQRDVIVITGTGGMGVATAHRVGAGHHLVIADYNQATLDAAVNALRSVGHEVTGVPTDVSDPVAMEALAETAAGIGPLRAIVHTAGLSQVHASPEQILAVDAIGTAIALDVFLSHATRGTVMVCVASMAGNMIALDADVEHALATTPTASLADLPSLDPSTMDGANAYNVAKRSNQLRVEAAAVAWGARGARVVSVSPGVILTPMVDEELAGPAGPIIEQMVLASPSGRFGSPDDIAAVIEFLISPAASFITGTDVRIDGGFIASVRYPAVG